MTTLSPVRRREAFLIAGIAALYLLLWLLLPKPAFWGLDSGFKFQGMQSFAETGSITIPYPGFQLGLHESFRSIPQPFGIAIGQRQVSAFSPLFQVLGGTLFLLFGSVGPFLLPLLGGWAVLFASWRLWASQRDGHDGRLYLTLVGIGSPIMFYSLELWEHTIAAALITFAIVQLCPARVPGFKPEKHAGALAAGLLIGLAAGFRTESAMWFAIILAFWKYTGRSSISAMRFVFGVVGATLLVAIVNYWQTTVPYPLHVLTNLVAKSPDSMVQMVITRMQNFYFLLLQGFPTNLISLAGLLPIALIAIWPGWRREQGWWPYLLGGLAVSSSYYVYSLLSAPNRQAYTVLSNSLLWVVPAAGLAIFPLHGERRHFWRLVWIGSLITILALVAFSPSVKGIHWGPRSIVIILPLILIVVAARMQRWWSRYEATRPIIVGLVVVSVAMQVVSFGIQYEARIFNRDLNRWARVTGAEPVVTLEWWLGGDCATASFAAPWYIVRRGRSTSEVIMAMRSGGIQRFNYIESPPYVQADTWWAQGAKPLASDYFLRGKGDLRRTRLEIIPSGGGPSGAVLPGGNQAGN